ncbi:MAG: hypothetical protein AT708_00480 [Pyrobaculum sp. OCT_11]|jgi:hypothetical protein|nr:MAG: hypothetical protein AT708_00480 [Pyrobaculum sp. OCT_11]
MIITTIGNIIEILLRRQDSVTSEDVKMLLKRANIQISDSEFIKALMILEIYKKIHVKKIKREGRDIFQITRSR